MISYTQLSTKENHASSLGEAKLFLAPDSERKFLQLAETLNEAIAWVFNNVNSYNKYSSKLHKAILESISPQSKGQDTQVHLSESNSGRAELTWPKHAAFIGPI